MTFNPGNTVADLKTALGNIASTQIAGITRVYTNEPDGPPEDNSVIVGSPQFKVLDETVSKGKVVFTFPIRYCVTRRGDGEDIVKVESYFLPFMLAYSAWSNQNLDPDAFICLVTSGGIAQFVYAGQTVRALIVNVSVTTEFNVNV
jgi:hypothetical protein